MGRQRNRNRQGRAVEQSIYRPFYERGNRYANPAQDRVIMLENMYQRILAEMCMGRYKWSGLPESVDTRFLELTLYRNGLAVLMKDNMTDKFFAVRASPSTGYDVQDNPISFTVQGNHFKSRVLQRLEMNHVPVWANAMRMPDWDIVYAFSHRLAQLDRTIEINTNNARATKILAFDESSKLTVQNINTMIDNGESAVSVSSQLDLANVIQTLDLGIDADLFDKLSVLRNQEWNRCMGLLGINNSNQDKKERLVAAEVDGNDDQVATARETNLKARRKAAETFNKMFPEYHITVDYHDVDGSAPAIGMGTESVDGA